MITRFARELDVDDHVVLFSRRFVVARVEIEDRLVHVWFPNGSHVRLPTWLPVPCIR